jgi:uncharacterized repeat protein (TIGR01451 family)
MLVLKSIRLFSISQPFLSPMRSEDNKIIFMKNINNSIKYIISVVISLTFILGIVVLIPTKAKAYDKFYLYNQVPTPIVFLTASPSNIQVGQGSNLSWSSSNTTSCSTSWNGNNVVTYGSTFVYPTYTTTYRITCYGYNGQQVSSSATIYVNNNYTNYYPYYQNYNNYQNNNQLFITTNNATNITSSSAVLNGLINVNDSYTTAWFTYGTSTNFLSSTTQTSYNSGFSNYSAPISGLTPNTTYYFRLVAQNPQGGIIYGNTLSFNTTNDYVNNQPTVVLSTDNTNLSFNEATNLRWFTTNATSCYASNGSNGWTGAKSIGPGSFYTGSLTESETYTITCSNSVGSSSTDRVTVNIQGQSTDNNTKPTAASSVIITSSVDSDQSIVPTLDNAKPRPGDEINYTVNYQNVGTGTITGLTMQVNLPQEINYISSSPNNPNILGNTLIFDLGKLKANGQGAVTVKAQVQNNTPAGTYLNFPAILSYVDPSLEQQSINADVSAQVFSTPTNDMPIGANVFGAGFLPTNIFGWMVLIIFALLLVLLGKNLFGPDKSQNSSKKGH